MQFWLIIFDQEKKEFCIHGPMTDDRSWNEAAYQEQQRGRRIRCVPASFPGNPKEYVRRYWTNQGYKEVEAPIVLPGDLLD